MDESKWISIRTDHVGLFTADLKDGGEVLDTLGGSYPKVNSVVLDARRKWGYLPTEKPSNAEENIVFEENLFEV